MEKHGDTRHHVGERIQQFRHQLRLEQKELASLINALDSRACCHGNMISRWEQGRNLPSPFYQELLCEALLRAGADAFAGTVPAVDRRAFVREALGLGMMGLLSRPEELPWERVHRALEDPCRIDHQTVDGLELVTIGLERLEQQVGPLALIGPTVGHLDAMNAMLGTPMPAGLRPKLCSVAAETAGLVSIAKAQAGHVQRAAVYLKMALDLAREANDRALGAWLMGRYTGSQPAYRDDPELRLRHVVIGAFGFSPGEATPAARAWFATKAADLYGLLGRTDDCLRALERAEQACNLGNRPDLEPRPRHAFCGLGDAWLASERGASLARIGQSEAARASMDRAIQLAGPDIGRVRLWLTLAKARTHVHDGEPGEACRLASEVAARARELHFDLVLREVRALHSGELRRWTDEAPVRALDEQLGSG
jgi:transcriptional regulator with XRE-family HTH domain